MRIGTTKEYNNLLSAACEMESVVRFYNSTDELCRRKVLEAALELDDAVMRWNKSIDAMESDKKCRMTNREWANQFLPSFLCHVVSVCYHCGADNMYNNNPCCPFKKCVHSGEDVEKWLNKKRKNHLLESDNE